MLTKANLGINGEHTALGNELSMAEFKGYTIKALADIEKRLEKQDKLEDRIGKLEEFKTYCIAFAGGFGIAGGLLWEAIKSFIIK